MDGLITDREVSNYFCIDCNKSISSSEARGSGDKAVHIGGGVRCGSPVEWRTYRIEETKTLVAINKKRVENASPA